MMTLEQIQAELAETHYRPGWSFEAYQHPFRGPMLIMYMDVIDSRTGDPTTLGPRHNIPKLALRNATDFHHWLLGECIQAEVHEAVENYRVRGVPLIDPHDAVWPELGDPKAVTVSYG